MNHRLEKLKTLLTEKGLDAILISSVPNIVYLTEFAHFSTIEREAFLLITKNNQYIITDRRYSHAVRKDIKDFELLEISYDHSSKDLLEKVITNEQVKALGIEKNNLTVHEWEKIKDLVEETKHFDISPLRIIKDSNEIDKITKACELGDQAFAFIQNQIKEGMTEKEVAFALESFIRKNGADISFPTIVAFEENAAIPHHKTGDLRLENGDLILLDFGVKYEEYCSDMTRTICFGPASEEKKKIHQTVKEAQNEAIKKFTLLLGEERTTEGRSSPASEAQTGVEQGEVLASDLDNTARDYIISKGYPSIPHSLGHGIGLEVHEAPSLSPKSTNELKEGMVFSIEPGIYLNDNCGVRIEDLFTIQNGKLLQLTQSSKELIEL